MLRFQWRHRSKLLSVGLQVKGSAEAVWSVLTDTGLWPVWGPSVFGVDIEGPDFRVSPGMCGRVRTIFGVTLSFEIDHVEPERSWGWRVGGVRATGHEVEPEGPEASWIIFTMPLWAFAYIPVCLWAAKRIAALVPRRLLLPVGAEPYKRFCEAPMRGNSISTLKKTANSLAPASSERVG